MATVTSSKRQLTHTSNTYESNGDVTVGGNLNINGTTTTIDTANLLVEDKNIIIGDVSSPSDSTADGGGITLKGATDKTLTWVNSSDAWTFNQNLTATGYIHTDSNLSATGNLETNGTFILNTISAQNSEATALVINGSGLVGTRELGSNAFNSTSFLTSYTETDTLATVTGRGRVTSTNGSSVWDTTTQGTTQGSLHLMSIGSDHAGGAITFDASDSNGAQAGIYVKSDGSYGTKMYLSTTDSFSQGSKSAISINHQGYVNIVRGNDRLTVNGNTVWHSGNDGTGTGLDADKLDGVQASSFLRSDAADSTNSTLTSTNGLGFRVDSNASSRIEIESGGTNWAYLRLKDDGNVSWDIASYNGGQLEFRPAGGGTNAVLISSGGVITATGMSVGAINTTGTLDISNTYPRINLNDTNHDDDWSIINDDGNFTIYNVDDGVHALRINSSNATTFAGNIALGGGALQSYHSNVTSALALDDQVSVFTRADQLFLGNNLYYGSGDAGLAIETGKSSLMQIDRDKVRFYFAASASAGQNATLQEKFRLSDSGDATFAGTITSANILPISDAAYTIGGGSSSLRWNYLYLNNTLSITDGNINAGTTFDFNQGANFLGNVSIAEKLIHTGDTNTYIQFPATNDKIVFATNGSDALTLNGDGANTATFAGNIAMGDNDVTGIDQLTFTSGTYLTDVSSNYVKLNYASTGAGGMIVYDGDSALQGYLYADGASTPSFGLLTGAGQWGVRTVKNGLVELRYDNAVKLQTTSGGVTVTGDLTVSGKTILGNASADKAIVHGHLGIGEDAYPKIAYPGKNAQWSGSGTTTGQIVIDLPGTLANYDMMYMEIDIYEYSSVGATKLIIGGHNWNSGANSNTSTAQWYNVNVQVLGALDKPIYFGRRNDGSSERRCIAIGETNSSWSYGTVHVSKVSGASSFYTSAIDWIGDWNVDQTTSGSYFTKNPTTNFNSGATLETNGTISAAGGSFSGVVTAATTSSSENSTKVATTAYVKNQGYVTSSGNTIIGTDSDINTSGAAVLDQLVMTDGVITSHSTRNLTLANLGYTGETNATADQTATEIRTLLQTVDGSGSGLDADLLDGIEGNKFLRTTTSASSAGPGMADTTISIGDSGTSYAFVQSHGGKPLRINPSGNSVTIGSSAGTAWHSANDGSGSGLDADLLDGLQLNSDDRNDSANVVCRTQANGYAYFGWLNTTSGNNGTTAISRIYASHDGFVRYYTPANFGAQIGSHISYNDLTNKPTIPSAYSLPAASSSTRGGVKIGYSENGKNYPVEVSSEKMYVNVPWSDTNTNTTYSAGTGISLSGTTFSLTDTASKLSLSGGTMSGAINTNGSNIVVNGGTGLSTTGNETKFTTAHGYIELGPKNSSWAHIYSSGLNFYFNNQLYVLGQKVFHDTYHPNADTLTTARTISLAGNVTGSVSFNGSSNVSISTSLAANSVGSSEIAAGAVGASEIGNDVVNSQHYAAGSIDNEHIADNAINSEHYADNSIDALHLNVSGNGSTSQFLRSDGDGTFTWATPTDTNTTYSAGRGLDLSGTQFLLETDLRDSISYIGYDSNDYVQWSNNSYFRSVVNGSERFRVNTSGIDVNGTTTSSGFLTDTSSTQYNLLTRNHTSNTLYVQAAQSGGTQPIATFRYGSTTANAGSEVLAVRRNSSYFVNTKLGIGTTSPSTTLDVEGPIAQKVYTIAALPSASPAGQRAFVSNSGYSLQSNHGSTLTGGGSYTIPVYSDGSSWRAG